MELTQIGPGRWALVLPKHLRYTRQHVVEMLGLNIPVMKKWTEKRLLDLDAFAVENNMALGNGWRRYSAADVMRFDLMREIVAASFGWEEAAFVVNHVMKPWYVEGKRELAPWLTDGRPTYLSVRRVRRAADAPLEVCLHGEGESLSEVFAPNPARAGELSELAQPVSLLVIDLARLLGSMKAGLDAIELLRAGGAPGGADE